MPHVEPARQTGSEPDQAPPEQPVEPPENEPGVPEQPHELAALAIAGVSALESDGALTFTVSLSRAAGEPVMVRYATEDGTATAGSDYAAASGRLTFAALSTAARTIVVTVRDDAVDERAETFTVRLSDAQGATLAVAAATGTIDDDDVRAVAVQPAALNVSEGGRASYTVVLGSRPTAPVTVTVAAASEVAVDPVALVFTPVGWGTEQTVTVSAAQDDDALADAPVALAHVASGGDYAGAPEAVVQVTIVEDDVATLAVTGARAVEGAGNLRFAVSLSLANDAEVTVDYASGATGDTATAAADSAAARGKLVFARGSTAAQVIEGTVADAALDEPDEELTVTLSNPRHAVLAGGGDTAVATGTIDDDDDAPPELRIAPGSLSEGADEGLMRFAVSLDRASGHTVTVRYATADLTAAAGTDYTPASGTLTFEPGQALTRTVAVPIVNDALDEPDEQFTVTLSAAVHATLAGGRTTTGTIADDDEAPKLTIAHASLSEGAGMMKFAVSLDPASGHTVTVRYATADGTATAGADYEAESGTLTFGAGSTQHTVAVPIVDDQVSEEMETFTVTLSDPERATLSETTATGTITDDDEAPKLTIAHASLSEGAGMMKFAVSLDPASGHTVTVRYATADGTATAGADYEAESGTLTFGAGSTQHTVAVPIVDDQVSEEMETFTVTLSDPERATLFETTATGTIADDDAEDDDAGEPLQLSSLQVTGGGTMYPAFDADIHHYALTCSSSTTLQVTAQARRSGARLTLLRDDSDNNHSAVGALDVQVSVNEDHDVVIELSDGGETTTYIVHCRPSDFTEVRILKKLDGVTEGLLFVTPRSSGVGDYGALIDYNGVPRFVITGGYNFRPYPNGPTIDGKRVRYGMHRRLLDEEFELIRHVDVVAPLTTSNGHDFLITDRGFLFISYHDTTRDLSDYEDENGDPLPSAAQITDSVIQEVAPDGTELFRWNSWDHMDVLNAEDCLMVEKYLNGRTEYAHLNSLQIVDGDIIASFRGCAQVLRIDRSSGSGAVEWKLGGTATTPDPDTTYLPLVGDPAGEFCGQHHVTLTASGTIVMFDNGVLCLGPRKNLTPFSRVVEYDISSGTQAAFMREYKRAAEQGHSQAGGGVTVVNDDMDRANDRWLITWGGVIVNATVGAQELIAISEVDPVTGTVLFELSMFKSGNPVRTYRLYHQPDAAVRIPLNLP